MSIVVEQTLPYTSTQLRLDDTERWNRLFPLIRPSTKAVSIGNGRTVVVDTALAKANSNNVLVVAIVPAGNFSDRILRESHIAAFATEKLRDETISSEDIAKVLKENGFPTGNGVVVIKAGSQESLEANPNTGVLNVRVQGELELDHIISLLGAVKQETK